MINYLFNIKITFKKTFIYFFFLSFSAFFSAFLISFSRSLRSFSLCRLSFSFNRFNSLIFRFSVFLSSPHTLSILKSRESNCNKAPPSTLCSINLDICTSKPIPSNHWQTFKMRKLFEFCFISQLD